MVVQIVRNAGFRKVFMSLFDHIDMLPEDPILSLGPLYDRDERENKANLGVGSYKDERGNPFILETVKNAEKRILDQNLDKEYQLIDGQKQFRLSCKDLILNSIPSFDRDRFYIAETIGASGALRIGAEFLNMLNYKKAYLPSPTWANHKNLLSRGGLEINEYPYLTKQEADIDLDKLLASIQQMNKGDIILLHGCCQNPTGVDPTDEEWKEISHLIKERGIIPFFDLAYHGFKDDLEKDLFSLIQFITDGHEFFVSYSFSKNMGLYGERIGFLGVCAENKTAAKKIGTHIKRLIRGAYSTPPCHGQRIVTTILNDKDLKNSWNQELNTMKNRIHSMRKKLVSGLMKKQSALDFSPILRQHGLFTMLPISKEEVQKLRKDWGLYMPSSGRINVAGLTDNNIDHCIDAICSILS